MPSGRTLADGQETAALIPLVAEPAEVEVAPRARPGEARDAPLTVELGAGAQAHHGEFPLHLGLLLAEREEMVDECGLEVRFSHRCDDLLARHHLVRVKQHDFLLFHEQRELEALVVDVLVRPVVLARRHALFDAVASHDELDGRAEHHRANLGHVVEEELEKRVVELTSLLPFTKLPELTCTDCCHD